VFEIVRPSSAAEAPEAVIGFHIATALPTLTSPWFAVVTKPRHEKTVSAAFRAKGIPEFLPQYRSRRRWTDRTTTIELPLFPGYLFCRFDGAQSLAVRQTPGVVAVVGFAGKPEPIPEDEISAIRTTTESGRPFQPWPYPVAGDRVRIERGPLAGVSGIVLREKGEVRIVVSVELLQRSVAVEIERESLGAVTPWRTPGAARERRESWPGF
jgi:transcription termination/antitermination protein NusG